MSAGGSDRGAADHALDERLRREAQILAEVEHFRATADAEVEALHLELAILQATIDRLREAPSKEGAPRRISRARI